MSSERLLSEPIKFPELKRPGQETGDLIFIWSPLPQEWEILIIELQIGPCRSDLDAFVKLNMSFTYLKKHWGELFKSIGLDLPRDCTFWIRIASVSYGGLPFLEEPFVKERRRRIL